MILVEQIASLYLVYTYLVSSFNIGIATTRSTGYWTPGPSSGVVASIFGLSKIVLSRTESG